MSDADRRREEALDWARRIHDPAFVDWEAHIAWLEADPRHADALDAALVLMEDASAGLAPASPLTALMAAVNDNAGPAERRSGRGASRWGLALGGAVAAGLAAIVAVPSIMHERADPYRIETPSGVPRAIALADGTVVALNGGSAVELDHADPRTATLIQGEAFFRVKHDPRRPFAVRSGDSLFQDVGTSFDMVRDADGVRVAVREGAVMYDPKGAAVRLQGGQQIAVGANGATIGEVDPASVGGWRQGRLSYRDATLATIAADLSRSLGGPVAVDPGLADHRFSGVLMIDGDREATVRRIASVMDVRIRREGKGWQMAPLGR
jgi:transmembrane sensor